MISHSFLRFLLFVAFVLPRGGAQAQSLPANKIPEGSSYQGHLERLSQEPHPAGSQANERVRDYIAQTMSQWGWKTELHSYEVLLSSAPTQSGLEIVKPLRMPLNQWEYILEEDPYSQHPLLTKGYNTWSGSGDVTAEVVYAHYGRKEDFEELERRGIAVKGKIVLARYGGNFRGFKAKFAEAQGAVGLVIFTDPKDSGYSRGPVYPEGVQFSASAIQRGSLLTLDYPGDPLTPFVAALPAGEFQGQRLSAEEVGLHQIPVLPIGYGAAQEILSRMQGLPVPAEWQGGLPMTYRLEGGQGLKLRLFVEQRPQLMPIHNVVGTWEGTVFPEEKIILGCHYDAWTYGTADPNSGTALLLLLAENLAKRRALGWQPMRTLQLVHWDAEEQGLMGSTEWVEQWGEELRQTVVAYINLDAAVTGPHFYAAASPSLKTVLQEAVAEVLGDSVAEDLKIGNLGGGSDHIGFYMHLGIPSLSMGMGGPYLYHTAYDNLHFYRKFIDSTDYLGEQMEQICRSLTLRLSEAPLLAYDPARYGLDLTRHFEDFQKQWQKKRGEVPSLPLTEARLYALQQRTQLLGEKIQQKAFPEQLWETLNASLKQWESCFYYEGGMPFGAWYRSLYASTDPYSGYSAWILPPLQYALEEGSAESLAHWDSVYALSLDCLLEKCEQLLSLLEE
jgi:N-acetylated-alpha-linked acidic dipeptidase